MTARPRSGKGGLEVQVKLDRRAIENLSSSQDMEQGLLIIGGVGEAAAKQHAPVDTGTLRRSITHELGKRGINLFVRIGTNIEYAIFQELGTIYHPAHPFLRPAIQAVRVFMGQAGDLT